MAKRDKSTAEIQRLLKERRKVEQWLDRLDLAADKTSEDVRTRVRGDYEQRLTEVNGKLQGFVDDIEAALAKHRDAYAGFKEQEEAKSKELAEAELRHAVGEFDEDVWARKKAGILEELVSIREGLAEAEEEIDELESVLTSLAGDEEEDDDVPAPAAAADNAADADEDEELPPVEVNLEPAGSRRSSQTDAFGDELEFLKSVTEDEEQGPAPGRASGSMPAIADEEPAPTGGKKKASGKQAAERTLKCAECGAMNLPTEWYCERCGAELAAL